MNRLRPCRSKEPATCKVHGVKDVKLSKRMSYVLRHDPSKVRLKLDANGWVRLNDLATALNVTRAAIVNTVRLDEKQRYTIKRDNIRAAQGHSIEVDLQHEKRVPPTTLYHGTVAKFVGSIQREGLKRGERLAVHLSEKPETAAQVGARRGDPVILEVEAGLMSEEGFTFHRSENGVWLASEVPPRYITVQN